MSESNQIIDASAAIATSKIATYAGSGVAGVSAFIGSIDLAFWISILIAIAGFIMNLYYARKKDKRDEIESKAFLESLEIKGKCDVEK